MCLPQPSRLLWCTLKLETVTLCRRARPIVSVFSLTPSFTGMHGGFRSVTAGSKVNWRRELSPHLWLPKLSIHRDDLKSCQNGECDPAALCWAPKVFILPGKLPQWCIRSWDHTFAGRVLADARPQLWCIQGAGRQEAGVQELKGERPSGPRRPCSIPPGRDPLFSVFPGIPPEMRAAQGNVWLRQPGNPVSGHWCKRKIPGDPG